MVCRARLHIGHSATWPSSACAASHRAVPLGSMAFCEKAVACPIHLAVASTDCAKSLMPSRIAFGTLSALAAPFGKTVSLRTACPVRQCQGLPVAKPQHSNIGQAGMRGIQATWSAPSSPKWWKARSQILACFLALEVAHRRPRITP